ncbi:MAG TPA: PQQ-binding-like beta-propeller repeat protein [Streptosporangiaceae bacterium]
MRLAASECPSNQPLTTGQVLFALTRVDVANSWQRIWLHTGDPAFLGLADVPDDRADREPERWEGVPLSASLADALKLLDRICDTYRLTPAPPGALALVLLADSSTGAARVLLRSGSVTHAKLLELVQSDLLDTTLEGVDDLIARQNTAHVPASPARVSPAPRPASGGALPVPASRISRDIGRRSGRRQVRRWRALSGIALALIAMALFWHREFLPPPTALVIPPYQVPAVEHHILTTSELPVAPVGRGGWLPMEDGPPTGGIWVGSGRLRADLRREAFVGAWQRTWQTADGQDIIEVAAYETRDRAIATSFLSSQCAPEQKASMPGAAVAGYVVRESTAAEACAAGLRGRTVLAVTVWANGRTASGFAWDTVKAGLGRQLPRVAATASDLPPISTLSSSTRIAILSTQMGIVLGIPVLLGLITMARDRSSWRRLRSRLSLSGFRQRERDNLGVFPVDSVVNVRLARHTVLALTRIAVLTWTMRGTEVWRFGMWQTGAALVTVIAAMLTVEWLVRRSRPTPWRPAVFDGSRRLIAAASLLLSAALAGAGIFLIIDGSMASALDINPVGADFVTGQLGLAAEVLGAFLIFAALLPFLLARRLGMRALRDQATAERSRDKEQHQVLMLRSFADDRRLLRARRFDRASIVERLCLRRFERFEEVAASALGVYGPVLAVSPPGEKLPPPIGAERRSFPNETWEERVDELISATRLICVTVGRSESVVTEVKKIRAAGALGRTVFLLPPTGKSEQRKRLIVLAYALGIEYPPLDQTRPDRDVLAVVFPGGDGPAGPVPVVLTGAAPDDVGYESAIGAWALAVPGDQPPFPPDVQRLSADLSSYAAVQAAHPGARTAEASRPGGVRPNPERLVYPQGKAPVYKPGTRRMLSWRLLPWTLSILIIPAGAKLIGANNVPTATVQANDRVTLLAQDDESPAVYAVIGGHLIQRIDFSDPQKYQAAQVTDFVTGLVVDGPSAYYTSRYTGHVGRIDLRTGKTVWVRSLAAGVQSAALADGRIVVTSPVTDTVAELSAVDGHITGRRELPGLPFGVAASGERLYVTLARANQVAELDARTLKTEVSVNAPNGPRNIYAQGKQVWVMCALAHEIIAYGTGQAGSPPIHALWLSVQSPVISGADGWLSIQGQEWVSLVSPGDLLTRIPLASPDIMSMVVQPDGSVIVGYSSGEIDKLGPVKS